MPIIIIDWKGDGLSRLAPLCAFAPDIVGEFSSEAGVLANALQPSCGTAVDRLGNERRDWSLGFETLRTLSHERLKKIWTSPPSSKATLNQNAAGGAPSSKRIPRLGVSTNTNPTAYIVQRF